MAPSNDQGLVKSLQILGMGGSAESMILTPAQSITKITVATKNHARILVKKCLHNIVKLEIIQQHCPVTLSQG